MKTQKVTFVRISNALLFISCFVLIIILYSRGLLNVSQYKGTLTALDAYINFTSISIGFLATVISMLTVIIKQKYLGSVLSDKTAKQDFIILGVISIITGFISVIIAVILTFIISNGNIEALVSTIMSAIFIFASVFYLYNFYYTEIYYFSYIVNYNFL